MFQEKKKEKDSNRIITCLHDSSDKCVLAQMGVCQFVNAFLCYLRVLQLFTDISLTHDF